MIIEVRDELPARRPTNNRYGERIAATIAAVNEAKDAHPGKWCKVATYKHSSSASSAARSIKKKWFPEEPVEFVGRTDDGEHALWARWPKTGD